MSAIRRRRALGISAAALLAMTFTACTKVSDGSAVWDADQASASVDAADVDDIVLDASALSELLGATVELKDSQDEPFDPDEFEYCDVMGGAGFGGFLGDDWEGFALTINSDRVEGQDVDHAVFQSVALYPDAPGAQTAFADLREEIGACDGEQANSSDAVWTYAVDSDAEDQVVWTSQQLELGYDWKCYAEARLRNNAILRALTCRAEPEGRENTTAILQQMTDTVWELSGPGGI